MLPLLRNSRGGSVYHFTLKGGTFPLGTTSLLDGSSGLQEAYTKACPNSAEKFTATCWCHVMTPCQDSWFSGVFGFTGIKKPSFSIIPAVRGTYKFTQRHTCDFSANFGALEHVLVVQIWIMHIKCPETQLMHKNAKRTRYNSKFKHGTHVLVACSRYVNVLAIQTPSFPSVTPFCLSKHNEKIRYTTNSLLERIMWDAI